MKLKLVSLNIWHGGKLWDELLNFLSAQDADILTLQEVYYTKSNDVTENQFHAFDLLCDELDYDYAHFSPAFIEDLNRPEIIEQGSAIFSKYPLQPMQTVFYDIPYGKRIDKPEFFSQIPRNLQHASVNLDGLTFHLFNTQGIWGEDGLDNDRRLAMVDTILSEVAKVDQQLPIILTGDFNVNKQTQAIAKLEQKFTNVLANQLQSTFNMKHKTDPGYASAVVDMVFISPNIKIISATCPDVDVSDHLPLVVELEV